MIGTGGESTKKDFIAELNTFSNIPVLNEICQIVPIIVSDGLLVRNSSITLTCADNLQIWRCFKVWNSSVRVVALSLFFLLTEIGNIPLHLFTT